MTVADLMRRCQAPFGLALFPVSRTAILATDATLRASVEERLIGSIEALWRGDAREVQQLASGDDCAIVKPPGPDEEWLLTTDQIVEGCHFNRDRHPPAALGGKALARSLSDIAAMGGRPLQFLQTVCLPDWALGSWHDAFQRGLRAMADTAGASGLALIGGDVARGSRFHATVTVIGCVERGTALRRSTARPGDRVYVSGTLGGSLLGLRLVTGDADPDPSHPAVRRHCEPSPRLALGRQLRVVPASAAMDLSDGLAIDADRLARASGVAITLEADSLPLFPGARLEDALRSGEEYELLFTIPPGRDPPAGADVTCIGRVEPGAGVWLETEGVREPLRPEGFSHF